MVQGNAILVVDLGNSSTKGMVLYGKDSQTGKYRERQFDVSNVFAPISSTYEVSSDYNDMTSTILNVNTELNGRAITGHFCNGELQRKEKPLATIKPTATEKKYNLDSSVLSFRLAFLYAYKAIMNMTRTSDYKQLDIHWTVVCLLPPGDMDTGKDAMKNLILDVKDIDIVYPEVKLPVNIDNVVILPEGFCAYAGVVYDKGHMFRQDYKYLTDETVLVFDIGAGTTDCLIISNNKLVQRSKYTVAQGGNNVYQIVRMKLRMDNLIINEDAIREGVIKGFVKDGAEKVSIVNYINEAKDEIAQKIISEFQDFLEYTDIKAKSVGYVLVCGGGSMQESEVEDIEPLSAKLISYFKTLSPNSALVDIPKHTVLKELPDGDVKKVEEQISPRDLNLIGASIMAEIV